MFTAAAARAGLFDSNRSGLQLDDYDYPLSEARIASYPLSQRDQSRMLVIILHGAGLWRMDSCRQLIPQGSKRFQ